MFRKNKNKDTQPAPLTELESALKAKIEKAENINDPIDRLLAYKALRDATEGTFDPTIADKRTRKSFRKTEESGWVAGFWGGALGGSAAGWGLTATVLTGGLAAVAIVPGVAIFGGAVFTGHKLGKKRAQNQFNNRTKKLSPEAKQATNMLDMTRDMDGKIEDLLPSDLSAIAQSSRCEEVKAAFPAIAAEFNLQAAAAAKQAEIAAKQAAFLGQTTPSTAGLRIAKPAA